VATLSNFQDLKGNGDRFQSVRTRLVDSLVTALNKRFADFDSGIIDATSIADLNEWPKDSETLRGLFGFFLHYI
jgi:hypothetical protein